MTVQNIGLLDARRNELMFSGLTIIVGVLLIGFGSFQSSSADAKLRPCPICAEAIQSAALKCRYCNADLPADFSAIPISSPAPPLQSFLTMLAVLAALIVAIVGGVTLAG
jgi:hypothetical protein